MTNVLKMTPQPFWKRSQHASTATTSGSMSQTLPIPLGAEKARSEDIAVVPSPEATGPQEKSEEQSLENRERHEPAVEEDHYAHGVKLAVITVCVALSVLLVALVSCNGITSSFQVIYANTQRIIQ